jgi:hypothetical protein
MQSDQRKFSNGIVLDLLGEEREGRKSAIRRFRWPDSTRMVVLGHQGVGSRTRQEETNTTRNSRKADRADPEAALSD